MMLLQGKGLGGGVGGGKGRDLVVLGKECKWKISRSKPPTYTRKEKKKGKELLIKINSTMPFSYTI